MIDRGVGLLATSQRRQALTKNLGEARGSLGTAGKMESREGFQLRYL